MNWESIDPSAVNPEHFDLTDISSCKVKEYRGTEDTRSTGNKGWCLFADLMEICPVTGTSLQEPTWYLFAAKGLA